MKVQIRLGCHPDRCSTDTQLFLSCTIPLIPLSQVHGQGTLVYTYGDKFIGQWIDAMNSAFICLALRDDKILRPRPRRRVKANSSTPTATVSKACDVFWVFCLENRSVCGRGKHSTAHTVGLYLALFFHLWPKWSCVLTRGLLSIAYLANPHLVLLRPMGR